MTYRSPKPLESQAVPMRPTEAVLVSGPMYRHVRTLPGRSRGLLWCLLLVPAVAHALPPPPSEAPDPATRRQAAHLLERGRSLQRLGRLDETLEVLEQAWRTAGQPEVLLELSAAYRAAGRIVDAVAALERYLALRPDDPNADALRSRLALMKRLAARRDAQRTAHGPREGPSDDRASGDTTDARTTANPSKPAGAAAADASHGRDIDGHDRRGSLLPWVLVGVGGALGASALATGLLALDAADELEHQCTPQPDGSWVCADPGYRDVKRRGAMLATATDVLATVSLLTAGAGVALWLFGQDDPRNGASRLSGACTPYACQAALEVRF